ncbi:hypothetical protein POG22_11070, partial [Geitlerinema sp. CS-897]|nr:hypothetical protein [Geitlerinema sp. CS-897]
GSALAFFRLDKLTYPLASLSLLAWRLVLACAIPLSSYFGRYAKQILILEMPGIWKLSAPNSMNLHN